MAGSFDDRPAEGSPPPAAPAGSTCPCIGNKNTGVFHYASCSSVRLMSEANEACLASRAEAIQQGYSPCGNCKP